MLAQCTPPEDPDALLGDVVEDSVVPGCSDGDSGQECLLPVWAGMAVASLFG